MTRYLLTIVMLLLSVQTGGCAHTPSADAAQPRPYRAIDWRAVDSGMARTGTMQPGDVYRFSMPRSDLTVTSRGVRISPSFALGSWLAFRQSGEGEAVAMGDLVLTESELNPVVARLQQAGIGQTAIHKHLLEMSPSIWWVHVHAHGDPVQIARSVRDALTLTGTPPEAAGADSPTPGSAGADSPAPALALDTAAISRILGRAGRNNSGVYSVSVPRAETVRAMGIEVPASMGVSTVLNFQPTGGGRAAINGDYVMVAAEIDSVISALRRNDIEIVELHHHLTDEEPRLFFLHFWANDDAVRLARGLREALDQTNSR